MVLNLLVRHSEPVNPSGQLQIIRVRPNLTKEMHLPPLRHGQGTNSDVGEGRAVNVVVTAAGVGVGRLHIPILGGFILISLVSTKPLPLES